MRGGVDSSAAAIVSNKRGYEVTGITFYSQNSDKTTTTWLMMQGV
jgi:tRNA U34 2-thiouridine synthase MnmA/TrmU